MHEGYRRGGEQARKRGGAEAAEKRRQVAVVLGSGGRLGGASSRRPNKSPRELAAEVSRRFLYLDPVSFWPRLGVVARPRFL